MQWKICQEYENDHLHVYNFITERLIRLIYNKKNFIFPLLLLNGKNIYLTNWLYVQNIYGILKSRGCDIDDGTLNFSIYLLSTISNEEMCLDFLVILKQKLEHN